MQNALLLQALQSQAQAIINQNSIDREYYLRQLEMYEAHLDYISGKTDINPVRPIVHGAKGIVIPFPAPRLSAAK